MKMGDSVYERYIRKAKNAHTDFHRIPVCFSYRLCFKYTPQQESSDSIHDPFITI